MIQRNPDFGKQKKSYNWIIPSGITPCWWYLQIQPISTAIMEVKAPLRIMERTSLDYFFSKVRIFFKNEGGMLDEHGRECQQGEKARRNAQNYRVEENPCECVSEVRDQSTENNDDEGEKARRSYRKRSHTSLFEKKKKTKKQRRTKHHYTKKSKSGVKFDHFLRSTRKGQGVCRGSGEGRYGEKAKDFQRAALTYTLAESAKVISRSRATHLKVSHCSIITSIQRKLAPTSVTASRIYNGMRPPFLAVRWAYHCYSSSR
jgi:hypothetical protein